MVDEGEKESVKSLVPLTGLFIAHTHPQAGEIAVSSGRPYFYFLLLT